MRGKGKTKKTIEKGDGRPRAVQWKVKNVAEKDYKAKS